jgi:hypothetical protein
MESLAGCPARARFTAPTGTEDWEVEVVDAARRAGRSLSQYETDTGRLVWAWARPDGTGPLFLTRRVALTWMADVLERLDPHDL